METTMFKFYSLGVVTKDKEKDSYEIEVSPVEALSDVQGNLSQYEQAPNVTQDKLTKGTHTSNLSSTASVTATWLQGENSQRSTAPDVKNGERVMLYTYADTQIYFWRSTDVDYNLRRLEDVVHKFGDNSSSSPGLKDDSEWTIRVNTVDKFIEIQTTKTDKEPYAYSVRIDAKEGFVSVNDDTGQHYTLRSNDGTFHAKVDKEITLEAPQTTVTGNLTVKKNKRVNGNSIVDGSGKYGSTLSVGSVINTGFVKTGGCKGCL